MDPRKSGQAGTSRRAGDYLSNLGCAALCAMTGPEWESAVRLFVIFPQLLKLCGAIHNGINIIIIINVIWIFVFLPAASPKVHSMK